MDSNEKGTQYAMDLDHIACMLNIRRKYILREAVSTLSLGKATDLISGIEFIEPMSTRLCDKYMIGVTMSRPHILVVSSLLSKENDDCIKISGLIHELGHVEYLSRTHIYKPIVNKYVKRGLDASELIATSYETGFYMLFPECIGARDHWLKVIIDSYVYSPRRINPSLLYDTALKLFEELMEHGMIA